MSIGEIQLGKNGITDNFIKTLKNHFNKHKTVKISVLKSAGHDREKVEIFRKLIMQKMGGYYSSKVIGFKIIIKKWRQLRR
ncbi:YhbY family RNA-binding protein [Nanoarchaeota archaeon]